MILSQTATTYTAGDVGLLKENRLSLSAKWGNFNMFLFYIVCTLHFLHLSAPYLGMKIMTQVILYEELSPATVASPQITAVTDFAISIFTTARSVRILLPFTFYKTSQCELTCQ